MSERPGHPEESNEIPKATLERLPAYLRFLIHQLARQEVLVSSEALAEVTGVNPAQVRKDLRFLGQSGGTPGVGYEVRRLIYEIEEVLGITKPKEAVLVGAGRLGSALVQYPGFERYGLDIVALFDSDERKVGGQVGEKPILPLGKLADLPLRLGIRLGIICVPAEAAQGVAELMVRAGIKVIWNFAPTQLAVPSDVFVRNEDLAAQLAKLSYYLAHRPQLAGETGASPSLDLIARDFGGDSQTD
jgi:redox-sensing transcriptional repressor